MKNNPHPINFKTDIPAGVIVFLIALPLCLGIALASGAPLFSGLITGIVGGIVVGALSGSVLSVSGPAAGLTVIVLSAIEDLGSFQAFLLAVLIAGIIQLVLGVLKAGSVGHYFPSAVIKGMLSAIGIILILKQIPHAIGYDADYEGDLDFFQADGENTFSEIFKAFNYVEMGAIIIFAVSIFILLLWERPAFKKQTIFKIIPGGLVVVIVGIVLNQFYKTSALDLFLSGNHVVSIGEESGLSAFVDKLMIPDFSQWANPEIYVVAFTIAIVASLETLLCIEAMDKLDPQKRVTPANQELRAQGIGNIVCGMLGGLPMTSVIVRSSANLDAGSQSKLSAILHGVLLFVSVVFAASLINMIPLASLAAILILVGYKLAKISLFKQMYNLGWDQFLPFIITVLAILFTDLLRGIGIGMVVSIFYILKNNYKFPFHYRKDENTDQNKYFITLSEEVTFLNKGNLLMTLRDIPNGSQVTIDGKNAKNIDHDVKEVIQNFIDSTKHRDITVVVEGIERWKDHRVH